MVNLAPLLFGVFKLIYPDAPAKAIRQLPSRDVANIPIIAMTANAFAAGMNGHIAK